MLCVGETAEERRQGLTFTIVEGQLRAGCAGLGADEIASTVLAYEPVWAIGTGVNATPGQAAEVHGYLRGLVSELASKETAQALRILYGGSVKPDNAEILAGRAGNRRGPRRRREPEGRRASSLSCKKSAAISAGAKE